MNVLGLISQLIIIETLRLTDLFRVEVGEEHHPLFQSLRTAILITCQVVLNMIDGDWEQ
jgi:hypothetical protein